MHALVVARRMSEIYFVRDSLKKISSAQMRSVPFMYYTAVLSQIVTTPQVINTQFGAALCNEYNV